MELLSNLSLHKMDETWRWWISISDPRVSDWFLMSSPCLTLFIVIAYLVFVRMGPRLMKNREPFDLRTPMMAYNIGISLLNLYICVELAVTTTRLGYSYVCQPVVFSKDPDELRVAKALWWFFFSKIIELADTVFLVLRKKDNQLSFLHVYHHASMIALWWIGIKWVAGGSAFFPAMTNSFIHVLMYSYYGLATLGPKVQRWLWWKPYLTQIQMVQFVMAIYFGAQSFFVPCDFPLWMKYALIAYAVSLLILFSNFYIKTYRAKGKTARNDKSRDAGKKRH